LAAPVEVEKAAMAVLAAVVEATGFQVVEAEAVVIERTHTRVLQGTWFRSALATPRRMPTSFMTVNTRELPPAKAVTAWMATMAALEE
jgi:hypothetical protein